MRQNAMGLMALAAVMVVAVLYTFSAAQASPNSPLLTTTLTRTTTPTLTVTPTATTTATRTPTRTPTAGPPTGVYTVTMSVIPAQTALTVGDTLTVAITIEVQTSFGCSYAPLYLSLDQVGSNAPIFDPVSDTVEFPLASTTWYTLSASSSGTINFLAHMTAEENCSTGYWNWAYAGAPSETVTVYSGPYRFYMPLIVDDR